MKVLAGCVEIGDDVGLITMTTTKYTYITLKLTFEPGSHSKGLISILVPYAFTPGARRLSNPLDQIMEAGRSLGKVTQQFLFKRFFNCY